MERGEGDSWRPQCLEALHGRRMFHKKIIRGQGDSWRPQCLEALHGCRMFHKKIIQRGQGDSWRPQCLEARHVCRMFHKEWKDLMISVEYATLRATLQQPQTKDLSPVSKTSRWYLNPIQRTLGTRVVGKSFSGKRSRHPPYCLGQSLLHNNGEVVMAIRERWRMKGPYFYRDWIFKRVPI